MVEIRKHTKYLAKICCVRHKLEIEKGRHNHVSRSERLCMNCNLRVIEDEYHVILICPKYFDIGILFTLPKYYTQPSLEQFCQLMNIKNADVICKLAACVHHVLQRQSAPELVFAPELVLHEIMK